MRRSRLQFLIEAQDRTGRAFSALQQRLATSEASLARMRDQFRVASAAATAFSVAVGAVARSAIISANETERFARVANAAPETFQRWAAASSSVGIQQDKLADILKDVNDRVGDFLATGGGPMADFFENIAPKVGVTADQFARLSGPQALQLYVDSLQKAGVTQGEMTFYLEAMASDLTMLLPLLQNSGAEMDRLGRRAEEFGAVMDGRTLMSISRVQTAMNEIGLVFKGAAYQLARELAPSIERVANAFTDAARDGGVVRRVIDGLTGNIERLVAYAGAAVAALGVRYVVALVAARLATLRLSGALVALRGALIRTGFGALIVAAGEMVYQFGRLVTAAGGFGEAMSLLGDVAGDVWQGIIDSAQAIPPALNGVWAKMRAGFLTALADMASDFAKFMTQLHQGAVRAGLDGLANQLGKVANAAFDGMESLYRRSGEAAAEAEGSFARAGQAISDAFAPARASVEKIRDLMVETSGETDGAAEAADRLNAALARVSSPGAGSGAADGGGGLPKLKDDLLDVANETQQAFDKVAKSIGDAMAGAIVQGKNMGEALGRVFQQIAQDLLSSGITRLLGGLFGGGGAGGGGGFLSSLFAGMFDKGGMIPAGQFGIAGERGPEIVRGPAHVTSRVDTARMMGGGAQRLNVTVTMDPSTGSLGAFVRDEAGRVVSRAAPQIVGQAVGATYQQARERPLP